MAAVEILSEVKEIHVKLLTHIHTPCIPEARKKKESEIRLSWYNSPWLRI